MDIDAIIKPLIIKADSKGRQAKILSCLPTIMSTEDAAKRIFNLIKSQESNESWFTEGRGNFKSFFGNLKPDAMRTSVAALVKNLDLKSNGDDKDDDTASFVTADSDADVDPDAEFEDDDDESSYIASSSESEVDAGQSDDSSEEERPNSKRRRS